MFAHDRFLPGQLHHVPAVALHPHAAGAAALARCELHDRPIHTQRRMVELRDLLGRALDVVPDQRPAEAIRRGVGVTAVDQRTVEEEYVARFHGSYPKTKTD